MSQKAQPSLRTGKACRRRGRGQHGVKEGAGLGGSGSPRSRSPAARAAWGSQQLLRHTSPKSGSVLTCVSPGGLQGFDLVAIVPTLVSAWPR